MYDRQYIDNTNVDVRYIFETRVPDDIIFPLAEFLLKGVLGESFSFRVMHLHEAPVGQAEGPPRTYGIHNLKGNFPTHGSG